jgi:hypothetical protein
MASRNWLARTATAVLATVREMNDAQLRVQRARMSRDAFLPDPTRAPETYQEFLYRTSGPAPREPTARRRAAGRQVR